MKSTTWTSNSIIGTSIFYHTFILSYLKSNYGQSFSLSFILSLVLKLNLVWKLYFFNFLKWYFAFDFISTVIYCKLYCLSLKDKIKVKSNRKTTLAKYSHTLQVYKKEAKRLLHNKHKKRQFWFFSCAIFCASLVVCSSFYINIVFNTGISLTT